MRLHQPVAKLPCRPRQLRALRTIGGGAVGFRRAVVLLALLALLTATLLMAAAAAQASSPPAGRIAFVRNGDIWTITPGGDGLHQLTGGGREDRTPAWSPDRRTVAFVRQPRTWGGTPVICLVPAVGGASHALRYQDAIGHTDFHFINSLAYSPSGRKLAFSDMYQASSSNSETNRLVVIDLKTGRTTVLIKRTNGFGGALDAGWPLSWSPDGRSLLVAQWGLDSEGGETHVFDIARRRLLKLAIADASEADWSPDGRSMVVSTATQEKTRVLIARASGTVTRTLLRGSSWQASAGSPAFSQACFSLGGSQIVYTVHGATSSLWIMNADGYGKHRLTAGEAAAWR
jgi:Tol biopolymer transport system component